MITHDYYLKCRQAEPYYYDLLYEEGRTLIPEGIAHHTEQCQNCREKIDKLKAALSQADAADSEERQLCAAVTSVLKLHFDYIGKPVTCNIAKPFIPCLLESTLEIRIPTPIITHLHNCRNCSEDIGTIRRLNLNRKQLCRLSRLFADKPADHNVSCPQARVAVVEALSMEFFEIDKEILKHLCACSFCRKLLYEYRETVRKKGSDKKKGQEFACDTVSASDVFDYVVPYGLDPAGDRQAKFKKSFISHAATCPNCLSKMQELHKTIYSIADRAESDVVTMYHVDETARAEVRSKSDDIYAGFPVRAEVTGSREGVSAEQPVPAVNFGSGLKKKIRAGNIKSLIKIVSVAAILLIGITTFLSTPAAKAVTIDQIYKAIEKVKNVHISRFVPHMTEEPIQERWISRALNVYMMKTGKSLILSDIPSRTRIIKQLDTGVTETLNLTQVGIAGVEEQITGSLGLMPFSDISDIPPDSEWKRVNYSGLEDIPEDIEVYDLIWFKKDYVDFVVGRKWRFFVDPETKLPQKTEFYEKSPDDSDYTLTSMMVIEYLSESEIQAVIKDAGF